MIEFNISDLKQINESTYISYYELDIKLISLRIWLYSVGTLCNLKSI